MEKMSPAHLAFKKEIMKEYCEISGSPIKQVTDKHRIELLLKENRLLHEKLLCAIDTLEKFSNESRPGGFDNARDCINRIKKMKFEDLWDWK